MWENGWEADLDNMEELDGFIESHPGLRGLKQTNPNFSKTPSYFYQALITLGIIHRIDKHKKNLGVFYIKSLIILEQRFTVLNCVSPPPNSSIFTYRKYP